MMISIFACLAVIYIVVGVLWLRRAYVGERAPLMVTIAHSRPEREAAGTRLFHAFLGIAHLGIGVAWLLPLVWKSHRLHWPAF